MPMFVAGLYRITSTIRFANFLYMSLVRCFMAVVTPQQTSDRMCVLGNGDGTTLVIVVSGRRAILMKPSRGSKVPDIVTLQLTDEKTGSVILDGSSATTSSRAEGCPVFAIYLLRIWVNEVSLAVSSHFDRNSPTLWMYERGYLPCVK